MRFDSNLFMSRERNSKASITSLSLIF